MAIQLADLPNWMSKLQNDDYVSSLSIPGTHDSAAFATTIIPFVQTQTLNFTQQLNAGIRFFDLRVNFVPYLRPPNLLLLLVHDSVNLGILLKDVFQEIYGWLNAHIGEAVFVQIKQDGSLPAGLTMADFTNNLFSLINQDSDYWRTNTDIPKMSDLQSTSGAKTHGKIQLIRRFDIANQVPPSNAGLDVTDWGDNQDRREIPPNAPIVIVQDHYSWVYADGDPSIVIGKKYDVVNDLMMEAASSSPPTNVWYFNYASAVRVSPTSTITPSQFAHGMYDADLDPTFIKGENFRIYTSLTATTTPKRYGVLMLDYPTDSEAPNLAFQIVRNNFFRS
ncbi:PLC-like phosphodiesterase [Lasiosphaeria hispida]|uniref:PLC-like phosphodiesterase n=1 Tax=Lasiosphaeria hispida TaxID=260671 RepID=A0AAJ0HCY2_9PEZI|nr:PLC-like phosphodiesterase [Lasiosphaeria hispida]